MNVFITKNTHRKSETARRLSNETPQRRVTIQGTSVNPAVSASGPAGDPSVNGRGMTIACHSRNVFRLANRLIIVVAYTFVSSYIFRYGFSLSLSGAGTHPPSIPALLHCLCVPSFAAHPSSRLPFSDTHRPTRRTVPRVTLRHRWRCGYRHPAEEAHRRHPIPAGSSSLHNAVWRPYLPAW